MISKTVVAVDTRSLTCFRVRGNCAASRHTPNSCDSALKDKVSAAPRVGVHQSFKDARQSSKVPSGWEIGSP